MYIHWPGCKWLWFGTCCLRILYPSVYSLWRRNFSKLDHLCIVLELVVSHLILLRSVHIFLPIFIIPCNFSFTGFKSSSDCVTFNYRHSSEDACVRCWKQGHVDPQSHRGTFYKAHYLVGSWHVLDIDLHLNLLLLFYKFWISCTRHSNI